MVSELKNSVVGIVVVLIGLGIIFSGVSTSQPWWVVTSTITSSTSASNFTAGQASTVNFFLNAYAYQTNFYSPSEISGSVTYSSISSSSSAPYLSDFKNMLIFIATTVCLMFVVMLLLIATLSRAVHKRVAGRPAQIALGTIYFFGLVLSIAAIAYIGSVPNDSAVNVYQSFPSSAGVSQHWPIYNCGSGAVFIGTSLFYGQFLTCSWVWGRWYYGDGVDQLTIEFDTGKGWYWAFGAFLTYFIAFVVYVWYASTILSHLPVEQSDRSGINFAEERELVVPEDEGFKIVDPNAVEAYDEEHQTA